jgi:hypothetical protein
MPKKNTWSAPSLNEVLAHLGYTTQPGEFGARHIIDPDGTKAFTGTAGDVWQWLRDEGEIRSTCCHCCRPAGGGKKQVELDLEGSCEDCHDELARAEDRQQRIDDYESRGDYLRDQQKDGAW